MEIQTLKSWLSFFMLFCCVTFTSCTEIDKYKKTAEQAVKERREVIEQNFENEQFIVKMYQELNRLSDDMTELQVNREYPIISRKSKMASIENNLKNIENQLSEAKESGLIKNEDKQIIDDLRNAIKRKDRAIQQLKSQIENLQAENNSLFKELQKKNKDMQEKNQILMNQLNEQRRMQDELAYARAVRYEEMGDKLRLSVIKIGEFKGHGNMKDIKKAQLNMLEECLSCYKEAYYNSYGSYRKSIEEKIVRTKSGKERYDKFDTLKGLNF